MPKALDLDQVVTPRKRETTNETSSKPGPNALAFDFAPTVKVPPRSANPTGTAIFQLDNKQTAKAVAYANQTFATLMKSDGQRVELQLRQLLPLQATVVANWGANTLADGVKLTSEAARLIKRYSELKVSETVNEALELSRALQPQNLIGKLFSKTRSVLSIKPQLIAIKDQLTQMLPVCDDYAQRSNTLDSKATLNLVALASACETSTMADDMVEITQQRRVLLQQAAQQYKLLAMQLDNIRQQMMDHISNVDQLLTITIPALEVAAAGKA